MHPKQFIELEKKMPLLFANYMQHEMDIVGGIQEGQLGKRRSGESE